MAAGTWRAGLEVTTKAVERTAEAIGEDIAAREREQIQQAVQLNLPVVVGQPIPILYIEIDGTGVPVIKAERREGKGEGQPATPGKSNWDASSPKPLGIRKVSRSATRIRRLIPPPSRLPAVSARGSIEKPGIAGGVLPKEGGYSATERNGSGILPMNTSPAPFKSLICFTPANTFGTWHDKLYPAMRPPKAMASDHQPKLDEGKIEDSWPRSAPSNRRLTGTARGNRKAGRLLREECRADAISRIPPAALVRWLGRDRGWL